MEVTVSALDELINCLVNFTTEQLDQFLTNEVTLSTLQPEGASESCLPGESLSA